MALPNFRKELGFILKLLTSLNEGWPYRFFEGCLSGPKKDKKRFTFLSTIAPRYLEFLQIIANKK